VTHLLASISYPTLVRIHLGPLAISPHGIGIAVGFLLGARAMLWESRKRGISDDDVYRMLTRAAMGAIVGARLVYVVNHWSEFYSGTPLYALKVWEGGLSLLGGILGAITFALPYMLGHRLSFKRVMDSAAIGLPIGIAIGRIGDLVIGDHLGKQTTFLLGYYCRGNEGSPCVPGTLVHQAALYDLFAVIPLLLFINYLRRRPRPDGTMIVAFTAWYTVERLIVDFARVDKTYFGLDGSQWTSLAFLALCLYWLAVRRKHSPVSWPVAPAAQVPAAQENPVLAGQQLDVEGNEVPARDTEPARPGGESTAGEGKEG